MNKTNTRPLKVGLLGCGTVGSSVARVILEQGENLAARIGRPLELEGIAVRDVTKERPGVPRELLTDDAMELVTSGRCDLIVELIGGIDPARELILEAINRGASVVSANKALLARHGREIFRAADDAGVDVYYEAAVAGAIPIIRPLRESLVGDEVTLVMGIVNGTTNYILDKMTSDGMDYQTALVQAQDLGYAEADPTADVEGHDAAAKAALLASLAFHTWVSIDEVYCEGITSVTPQDIEAAKRLGCVVKLLAVARLQNDGQISARVHPAMVPLEHPLASVAGANNAIFIQAQNAGELMFLGPGAGGDPTASAVVGDLVTIARHRVGGIAGHMQSMYNERPIAEIGTIETSYFLRLHVRDEPGILAQVAGILAHYNISIETVEQASETARGHGKSAAVLYMSTHSCREADLKTCVDELTASSLTPGLVRFVRVEGLR